MNIRRIEDNPNLLITLGEMRVSPSDEIVYFDVNGFQFACAREEHESFWVGTETRDKLKEMTGVEEFYAVFDPVLEIAYQQGI